MSEEIKEASQVTTEDAFYPTAETKETPVASEGDKAVDEQAAKPVEEVKTEEGEAKKDEEKKAEGEGEADLKEEDLVLSEGSELSKTEVQEIFAKAKELGLNKAQAQAFLDLKDQEVGSFKAKIEQQVEVQRNAWKEETMNDPKIGGANLVKNVELSKRAIDAYAPKELKDALDATGFGNNKYVIEMFANIGKDIGDQSRVVGSPVTPEKKLSEEEVFYGANT